MTRQYKVIDADGHILEPVDLWEHYIDPAFREDCPAMVYDEKGNRLIRLERGRFRPAPKGNLGSIGAREGTVNTNAMTYEEGRRGGFDPHARIVDMEAEDIDAAVLYPSLGLVVGVIEDPQRSAAIARAYNRWLADYCKPYPDRLFGAAMLPLQSVELAIKEIEYCAKELGFRTGFVRPNPYGGRALHHRDLYPLWERAQDLDFSIGIHGGALSGMASMGYDERFPNEDSHAVLHCISHTMEMMAAATSFLMCGVCDRFPRLRVAFLESGGGWMAGWLDRMDRHYNDVGMNDTRLSMQPSDLFRRQCFVSFEPVERTLPLVAEMLGPTNILWATDYPHLDGFWGAPQMIKKMGLRPDIERAVLAGGAMRFYGLN